MNEQLKEEAKYFEYISGMGSGVVGQQILRHTDILNAKAGSILTHSSMMIAAVSFFIAITSSDGQPKGWLHIFIDITLFVELFTYVFISIASLRCIFLTTIRSFGQVKISPQEQMMLIVRNRRRTHNASVKLAIITTLMFAVSAFLKIWVTVL